MSKVAETPRIKINRRNRRHIRKTLLGKDWSKNGVKTLNALAPRAIHPANRIGLERHFTKPGVDVYSQFDWETVDVVQMNWRDGTESFRQNGVEKTTGMSLQAATIAASKYFRGQLGTPERENSIWVLNQRITNPIVDFGYDCGYFATEAERDIFRDEFLYLLTAQAGAPNSPVWFNIGVWDSTGHYLVVQQGSACFILHVDDNRVSLGQWTEDEASIFYGGSGSGVNISNVRSSGEKLSGGGDASGPIPYQGGADMQSGAIKSGGKTRRAAKMIVMDIDHPDVEEEIELKRIAEDFLRSGKALGYDVDIDGKHSGFIAFQNANNSIRVPDEFMEAVMEDADWHLIARTTGETVKTVKARKLMRAIAQASWECADPGMQFDTTINRMHTLSNINKITASNPCSEYMSEDNSACNLLSLNLMKFLRDDNTFDVEGFLHAVKIAITYQEILVGYADYPTEEIAINANKHRQLGIGYANLGALVMALGHPYDSDAARAWCAVITALETGQAYATSSRIAARMGAFEDCAEPMIEVLKTHRRSVDEIDSQYLPKELLAAAAGVWDEAIEGGQKYGIRNSQASVLAPTGTIGLLMDCDTTGIEPSLGLLTFKKLVGGGSMTLVNQTVLRALETLGYDDEIAKAISDHVVANKPIETAPGFRTEHLDVFATSLGESNTIHYLGHLKMMAAAQPFISGAISKTVNLPREITVEELEALHITAWELGIKAVAVFRDGCKAAQPISTGNGVEVGNPALMWLLERATRDLTDAEFLEAWSSIFHSRFNGDHDWSPDETGKVGLPLIRPSITYKQVITDPNGIEHDHFVTWGLGPKGTPLEEFVLAAMVGSAYRGMLDQKGVIQSTAFKRGMTIKDYIETFLGVEYEPAGHTPDPDILNVKSHQDGLARLAARLWLTVQEQEDMGLMTRAVKRSKAEALNGDTGGQPLVPAPVPTPAVTLPVGEKLVTGGPRRATGRILQCTNKGCGSTNIQDGPCPTCRDCGCQIGGCTG
jgi:ribonucleoside-diphosphate reductase alpha chain